MAIIIGFAAFAAWSYLLLFWALPYAKNWGAMVIVLGVMFGGFWCIASLTAPAHRPSHGTTQRQPLVTLVRPSEDVSGAHRAASSATDPEAGPPAA